jgi:UDP-N-acetylmuramoyl-L-alanyl-D-glutamate--2,6-diaminopimelate ligase
LNTHKHKALSTPKEAALWLRQYVSGTLVADSRRVRPGDGFMAWPGAANDARRFVPDVLAAGAAACLVEAEGAQTDNWADDARVATYAGLKSAAAPIAAAFFSEPSLELSVIAVTGTNGKTSTAWWLAQALSQLGQHCAVVGTLGIGEPGALVFNGLTTPDPVLFQEQLRCLVDEGFVACAVEASSIGLEERRLDATQVHTAIFTNFTQDHLDYHGSMAAYWAAKEQLFYWPGLQAAVVNIDDAHGAELADVLGTEKLDVWTVSCTGSARIAARSIQYGVDALSFEVVEGETVCQVTAPIVGDFNVSNLLGVIASLRSLGLPLKDIAAVCTSISPVPGRMETLIAEAAPLVVIDYAHTPDALEKTLQALKPQAQSRGGKLWCLFGCGGDRDTSKRALMGAVASRHADYTVLTSDNPRTEKTGDIIAQILVGMPASAAVLQQPDRALAIAAALQQAQPQDVVLIAGKGHENYQDIQGVRRPFSDREQAELALATYTSTVGTDHSS